MADCLMDGTVDAGSQQQWFARNSRWKAWKGGQWNMVLVGTENPPPDTLPQRPFTVIPKTPVIREKPFLVVDEKGGYFVMVPALEHRERPESPGKKGQRQERRCRSINSTSPSRERTPPPA